MNFYSMEELIMQQPSNTVICTTAVPDHPEYLVGEAYQSGGGQQGRTWVGVPGKWGYQLTSSEVASHFTSTEEFPQPCKLQCVTAPNTSYTVGETYDAKVLRTDTALRIKVGSDEVCGNTTFNFTGIWQCFELEK